jgi:hypothetical protein
VRRFWRRGPEPSDPEKGLTDDEALQEFMEAAWLRASDTRDFVDEQEAVNAAVLYKCGLLAGLAVAAVPAAAPIVRVAGRFAGQDYPDWIVPPEYRGR